MKIRGAIFDMDGTLIDSLSFWEHLWSEIGAHYLADPTFRPRLEDDRRIRTMIYREGIAYIWQTYRIPTPLDEFLAFALRGLTEFYKTVARPKEGALALLGALRAKGIPMCLASATAKSEVVAALEYHGMLGYFDAVISCADIGVGKDKPDIYLEALRLLDLPPEETCLFEDSYVALETGKSIGLRTAGVFDRYNFGQDRLRAAAEIYLGEGESLFSLSAQFE